MIRALLDRRVPQCLGLYLNEGVQAAWIEGRIAELEDGDCRRAAASYDEAVAFNPRSVSVRVTRLGCSTELKRWEAARADADWVLEHVPGPPVVRLAVARYFAAPAQEARALRQSLRGA